MYFKVFEWNWTCMKNATCFHHGKDHHLTTNLVCRVHNVRLDIICFNHFWTYLGSVKLLVKVWLQNIAWEPSGYKCVWNQYNPHVTSWPNTFTLCKSRDTFQICTCNTLFIKQCCFRRVTDRHVNIRHFIFSPSITCTCNSHKEHVRRRNKYQIVALFQRCAS